MIPFVVRLELSRLKRLPRWILESRVMARERTPPAEFPGFDYLLARHESPLERAPGSVAPRLQQGKERNIALASDMLDGIRVDPCKIFSYYHIVGRPTRRRGFRDGLELRNGKPSHGVGGGCCQIANMLYLLALRAGMKITERHRHGLDLFPDHDRTVPFGCGATVFYNYADLRFENPLPEPVMVRFWIEDRKLIGELRTTKDPGWRAEIYEVDHRFYKEGDQTIRENNIHRRFTRPDGSLLLDQEVAHNRGRVMYDMECGEHS